MLKNIFLISVLLNLASCSFFKGIIGTAIEKPDINIDSITVKNLSLKGIDLEIGVSVLNQNDFDLKFKNIKYELYVFDTKLVKGVYKKKIIMKSMAKTKLRFPIKATTFSLINIAEELITKRNKVKISIKANTEFITPLGNINLDFKKNKVYKIP